MADLANLENAIARLPRGWERLEPVVGPDDSYLKVNRTFQVGRTTRKGLDAITHEIDAWYQMQSRHFLT